MDNINVEDLKKLILEKGIDRKEDMYLLHEFILHQLAVYHSSLDSRMTPRQFINFWHGQAITYLANVSEPVPSPEEYKQLIRVVPPKN